MQVTQIGITLALASAAAVAQTTAPPSTPATPYTNREQVF